MMKVAFVVSVVSGGFKVVLYCFRLRFSMFKVV